MNYFLFSFILMLNVICLSVYGSDVNKEIIEFAKTLSQEKINNDQINKKLEELNVEEINETSLKNASFYYLLSCKISGWNEKNELKAIKLVDKLIPIFLNANFEEMNLENLVLHHFIYGMISTKFFLNDGSINPKMEEHSKQIALLFTTLEKCVKTKLSNLTKASYKEILFIEKLDNLNDYLVWVNFITFYKVLPEGKYEYSFFENIKDGELKKSILVLKEIMVAHSVDRYRQLKPVLFNESTAD